MLSLDPNTEGLPRKKKLTPERAITILKKSSDWMFDHICKGRKCEECPMSGHECKLSRIEHAYNSVINDLGGVTHG